MNDLRSLLLVLLTANLKMASTITVDEGNQVTLSCSGYYNGGTRNNWQFETQSGIFNDLSADSRYTYDGTYPQTLTIQNVKVSDNVQYRCVHYDANGNLLGTDNSPITLQVNAVNGEWGQWGQWTVCSQTCGGGSRTRQRFCNDPVPSDSGQMCYGVLQGTNYQYEYNACAYQNCPAIDGVWGQWEQWTPCTKSCGGGGSRTRKRYCNDPAPLYGGQICDGVVQETNYQYGFDNTCADLNCPVHGVWGPWKQWNTCTKSCGGGGSRNRTRYCNDPEPMYGGTMCDGVIQGTNYQYGFDNTCADHNCPVDGSWGEWFLWSACTKSCGSRGLRFRIRDCDRPQPSGGGVMCDGVIDGKNYQFSLDYTCADRPCPTLSSGSNGKSQTTIIGGTIAGICFIILSFVLGLLYYRQRKKNHTPTRNDKNIRPSSRKNHLNDPSNTNSSYLNLEQTSGGDTSTDTGYDDLTQPNEDVKKEDAVYCEIKPESASNYVM